MKTRRGVFTATAMASAVVLFGTPTAFALSVGEPVVYSKLGQPLDAWIPVSLESPEEVEALDSFTASLAGAEAYRERSLETPLVSLSAFQLVTETAGGKVRLHLRSQQPFVEPMSTLLIKVTLGKISILRELALLIDLQGAAAPESALEAPVAAAASTPAIDAPAPAIPVKSPSKQAARKAAVPAVAASVAPQPVISRFQLDVHFRSYAQLAAAGKAPQPVTRPATVAAVATPGVAPSPAQLPADGAAIVKTPPAVQQASNDSGHGLLWLFGLVFLLILTAVIGNTRARQMVVGWLKHTKVSLPTRSATPAAATKALPVRPGQKAETATEFTLLTDDAAPEIENPAALSSRPGPIATPATGMSPGRQRLNQLQKQFVGDETKQKLKIAEAYLELNRNEAAMRLMDEVEHLQQSGGDRRLALVKR